MTLFEQVAAVASANHEMARASDLMRQATARINELETQKQRLSEDLETQCKIDLRLIEDKHELQTALNRMVQAHENLSADTEGKYPPPDAGCIECTAGTVPDRLNTGLCAYHNAKQVLGHS